MGYDDKMKELLRADPGLARRFPTTLALQDYTPCELAEIASKVAKERFDVPLEDGLEIHLGRWIEKNSFQLNISNHNGGLAVNLVEEALGQMAERVLECGIDVRAKDLRLAASDFGLTPKD